VVETGVPDGGPKRRSLRGDEGPGRANLAAAAGTRS
jgi:hypothetical protein